MLQVVRLNSVMWLLLLAALTFCSAATAQNQEANAIPRSDLAQENLRRVAASPQQIHAVLTKNPGLIVELKRWLAKDATDHGQMVTDEDLTDQAVLDRLEQDVKFRSIATRLLQRYGYLLPKVNPDSDLAKQQDLLLQARAGQLMQTGQSETVVGTGLMPGQPCDPDLDAGCSEEQPRVTPLHSEQQTQTGDQQISPAAPCRVAAQNSACAYPPNGQSPNLPITIRVTDPMGPLIRIHPAVQMDLQCFHRCLRIPLSCRLQVQHRYSRPPAVLPARAFLLFPVRTDPSYLL
jgi:hypothetical protein